MINSAALEAVIGTVADKTERVTISTLGVTTCDRPPLLKRCLRTYASHLRKHGRRCHIIVVDDSLSESNRNSCREWLRVFAEKSQLEVYYAGLEEKLAYVRTLSSEGIPEELSRFVLTRTTNVRSCPGANRNALLLQTTGQVFLSCDDDSACQLYDLRMGNQSSIVVPFSTASDRLHFVSNKPSAVARLPRYSDDLLTAHENLLGQSLRSLTLPIQSSRRIAVGNVGARIMADLLEGQGEVTVTMSGVFGNSGLPHAASMMISTGDARERILRSNDQQSRYFARRRAMVGVSRFTLSAGGPFATTTASGFDNRTPLPPFIPFGRGEDTLFGLVLSKCRPHSYVGHVPIALLHQPLSDAPFECKECVKE
jgi:hypothetical protein